MFPSTNHTDERVIGLALGCVAPSFGALSGLASVSEPVWGAWKGLRREVETEVAVEEEGTAKPVIAPLLIPAYRCAANAIPVR